MAVGALLLDTQVFLWLQVAPHRLGAARDRFEDTSTALLLSAASSWEIAIKHAIGKLQLPDDPRKWVPDRMRRSGVGGLAVEHSHALAVADLPPEHRDPFDRLLVAQALAETLVIATADPAIRRYPVDVLWLGSGT